MDFDRRLCILCKTDVGDEYHYILNCNYFRPFRKKNIKAYYNKHPNTLKFSQLMNSKFKAELKKKNLRNLLRLLLKRLCLDFQLSLLSLLVLNRLSDKYFDFHVFITFQLFITYTLKRIKNATSKIWYLSFIIKS